MPPSRTCIWAAAARAFGAREPDDRVRNRDWMAVQLLGPEERALLTDHPLIPALDQAYEQASANMEVMGAARLLIPRTHFIDDRLQAALRAGVRQIVVLGAGFDSRAYRFAKELEGARVIEVDQPDTQRLKTGRIRSLLGDLPPHVVYAPVDLTTASLGEALARAGYVRDQRTFFIWEGVTFYLTEDAVRGTLRWIADNAAAGSSLIFDYAYNAPLEWMKNIDLETLPEAAKQAVGRFRNLTAGEPWIFGLPDNKESEFLSGLGLELHHNMGINSREAVENYLTRKDGSIFGSVAANDRQWYSILEAQVPAR